MRKKAITILIFIVFMNILQASYIKCYAKSPFATQETDAGGNSKWDPLMGDVNYWQPNVDDEHLEEAGKITKYISIIGIIISIITLSIIGIKFMLGSVEERAQYKQNLMPWLIGAIMVFAITTIPSIIYTIARSGIFGLNS